MPKTPHCPKGMQFVNADYLVDAHELNRAEEKIRTLFETEQDQRQTEVLEKIDRDIRRQADLTANYLAEQHEALQASSKQYVDDRMAHLLEASRRQDVQIVEIRRYQEEEAHALKVEMSKKFVGQRVYNDALNERMK